MDIKNIKKLMSLLESSKLSEIELETAEGKIKLKKEVPTIQNIVSSDFNKIDRAATNGTVQMNNTSNEEVIDGVCLKSPLVGTFYDSPSPESPAFVKIGDRVSKGQVLCIVEAMKVMNEVTSPADGIVEEVRVSNEELLEYDQILMIIK